MGAEMCGIDPGDVVAVWGAGPVGQFAMDSARLLGAEPSSPSTRSRTGCRWRREAGPHPGQLRGRRRAIRAPGTDRRTGTGQVHRRGRHGGHPRQPPIYAYDRAKQAIRAGKRTALRPAPGDHELPQRRDGLGHRRVRRVRGQVPGRLVDEPVADPAHRPMPRAALHEAAARSTSKRADLDPTRIITHTLPLDAGTARLRHVQAQAGQLREGRPQALTRPAMTRGNPRPRARDATSHGPAAPGAGPGVPVGGPLMAVRATPAFAAGCGADRTREPSRRWPGRMSRPSPGCAAR